MGHSLIPGKLPGKLARDLARKLAMRRQVKAFPLYRNSAGHRSVSRAVRDHMRESLADGKRSGLLSPQRLLAEMQSGGGLQCIFWNHSAASIRYVFFLVVCSQI